MEKNASEDTRGGTEPSADPVTSNRMTGAPPFGADRLVTLADWQDPPMNRWSFQHVRELVPSAPIVRGPGPVRELPRAERDVLSLPIGSGARPTTVGQYLDATQTDAFLVLHRGEVVAEHYFNGMGPASLHLLMSVSKSITGALAGVVVQRGLLRPDAPITDVVPELAGSSFEHAKVQHLLDMRSGTRFDENYDDADADVRVYEQVYQWRPRVDPTLPADALAYFATLTNDGEHGGPFRYRSILTDVLAWVLERASGVRFHELVSSEIWAPMGAEFDAEVTLDPRGNAMADGGISATLRDVGRFGLLYLPGVAGVLPQEWLADTVRGASDGAEAFVSGDDPPGFPPGAHYRNGWWILDPNAPLLYAWGIYGQNVFVHGPTETVMVKLSTSPVPIDQRAVETAAAALVIMGEHLSART